MMESVVEKRHLKGINTDETRFGNTFGKRHRIGINTTQTRDLAEN